MTLMLDCTARETLIQEILSWEIAAHEGELTPDQEDGMAEMLAGMSTDDLIQYWQATVGGWIRAQEGPEVDGLERVLAGRPSGYQCHPSHEYKRAWVRDALDAARKEAASR